MKYTVYFINDNTHCCLSDRYLERFEENFKIHAENPKRKVFSKYIYILKSLVDKRLNKKSFRSLRTPEARQQINTIERGKTRNCKGFKSKQDAITFQ